MDYKEKYIKYKTKYLELKNANINNQIGGGKKDYGLALYDFSTNNFSYSGKNINKKSIFQCASLTKQVFTIIVFKMIQNNKLDFDKTIYDYLTPIELNMFSINEYFDKRYKKITIKMLLNHTSGLPNFTPDNPLSFNPGTNYKYSGNGFNLLQKIVEKIENKTLNEIYKDYKMKSSSFTFENKFNKNLALPYDGNKTKKKFRYDYLQPFSAATFYSNLEDYVNFIKDNKDIIKLMSKEQFKINKYISVGIGCLLYNGYIWQYGDNHFYKNFLLYDPFNNTGFISLSNNTHGWSLVKDKIPDKIKKFLFSEYKRNNLFD